MTNDEFGEKEWARRLARTCLRGQVSDGRTCGFVEDINLILEFDNYINLVRKWERFNFWKRKRKEKFARKALSSSTTTGQVWKATGPVLEPWTATGLLDSHWACPNFDFWLKSTRFESRKWLFDAICIWFCMVFCVEEPKRHMTKTLHHIILS